MYVPRQGDIVILQHPNAKLRDQETCPAIVQQVIHGDLISPAKLHLLAFPLDMAPKQFYSVPFYQLIPDTRAPGFTGCWPKNENHRAHLLDTDATI